MGRLVEQHTVFVDFDTVEISMWINGFVVSQVTSEDHAHGFKHIFILEQWIGSEVVVGRQELVFVVD